MNPLSLPTRAVPALALSCLALAVPASAGGGENGLTERVVFALGGGQLALGAQVSDVSADGRWVVFHTNEALHAADANGVADVYVLDLETDAVQPASVSHLGAFGDAASRYGRVSDDGRFVVFETYATNIVGFDLNGTRDVIRKDMLTGSVFRVSTPLGTIVSANDTSSRPDISANGQFVAFHSEATDLDAGTLANVSHIYWRDMNNNQLERVTTGLFGEPTQDSWGASISADGQRVAYASASNGLVLLDNNGVTDVFVEDVFGQRQLVSHDPGGVLGNGDSYNPRLSADGDYVLFDSMADNLAPVDTNTTQDAYWVDLTSGFVSLVSQLPGGGTGAKASYAFGLSADGRFALFASTVGDLTDDFVGTTAIYMRDLETGTTWLVSRASGHTSVPNAMSFNCAMSGDGSLAAFTSMASNLDQGDTNGVADVFVRTLFPDPTDYCVTGTTSAGCQPQVGSSGVPSASADSGFTVTLADVPNNKVGVLIYSLEGRAFNPVIGGTLCIGPLAGRSPGLFSAGNPAASDCSGSFTLDMNAFAAGVLGGAPHPALSQVGQQVNGQFWGRDPDSPAGFFFSEAIEYVVGL